MIVGLQRFRSWIEPSRIALAAAVTAVLALGTAALPPAAQARPPVLEPAVIGFQVVQAQVAQAQPGQRIGNVRRNAKGEIELVAPPGSDAAPAAPVPPTAAPPIAEPPSAKPPTGKPPAPRAAGPVGLPPAPAPVAAPSAPPAAAAAAGRASAVPAAAAPATSPAYERSCADSVLLCLGVLGGESGVQDNVPLTFGHPLAPKLLKPGERLVAKFAGMALPVQLDQIATHVDGSVRFAIFSLVLPRLPERGPHRLEIVADATTPLPTPPPIAPMPTDIKVEIETYAAPIYEVRFGDRKTPFTLGERITLVVGEGAGEERYTVTVAPEMAGGTFQHGMKIAEAFVAAMAKSQRYLAHRNALPVYEFFWITLREKPGAPFPVRVEYGGTGKVNAELVQRFEPRRGYVGRLVSTAEADKWLVGSIARESTSTLAPVRASDGGEAHELLSAMLGVRQYAGGRVARVEVVLENTYILPGVIRNIEYDAALVVNGRRIYEAKSLDHRILSRWHVFAWDGTAPSISVKYDRRRLLESGAIPFYDPDLRISASAIAATIEALRKNGVGPLQSALVTRYMPMTGGRSDIGFLPRWSVQHVLAQDPRLTDVVLANGDASGSLPIHYRDRTTGRPLNVAWNPDIRIFFQDQTLRVRGKPVKQGKSDVLYAVDTSHQPSLVYYPYLITGERYYLDELHFWASYNALRQSEEGRAGADGLLHVDQLRGQAWSLRGLANAALVTSDDHPLKKVFMRQLSANLGWYNKQYATESPTNPERLPDWLQSSNVGFLAPWQHDFMTIVVGQIAVNDIPGARAFALWLGRFGSGRFLAEDRGYCRANGPGYWFKVTDPATNAPVTTWRKLQEVNWPDQTSCAGATWRDKNASCTYCYTTIARAAMATLVDLGMGSAREPYDYIRLQTGNSSANFAADPIFAIVPRDR